jgi:magnesium chelatase family protein
MFNFVEVSAALGNDLVEVILADGRRVPVKAQSADRVRGIDTEGDLLVPLEGGDGQSVLSGGGEYLVPLTRCCQAVGKGSTYGDTGVVCRICFLPVSAKYGGRGELAVPVRGSGPSRSAVCSVTTRQLPPRMLRVSVSAEESASGPLLYLVGGRVPYRRELRDRVYAGLRNGFGRMDAQFEVDLGPVDAPAPDAAAVAVAVIAATPGSDPGRLEGTVVLGELGLDGQLRPTRGVLPATELAARCGIRRVIVPLTSLDEAAQVGPIPGLEVLGAASLREVAAWLGGDDSALTPAPRAAVAVVRQPTAPKRLLSERLHRVAELAAAGELSVLVEFGDHIHPGAIAEWMHALRPELTAAQRYDVANVSSLGRTPGGGLDLAGIAPFVASHPSRSPAHVVGGSFPGDVTLAHQGVLVLPLLGEFSRKALDGLASVMAHGKVAIVAGGNALRYPARTQIFATCWEIIGRQIPSHLLDRFPIRLRLAESERVFRPRRAEGLGEADVFAQARERVRIAQRRAVARWRTLLDPTLDDSELINGVVPAAVLRVVRGSADPFALVREAVSAGTLSERGGEFVMRLAWTAADLDGSESPETRHVEEALALRRG